MKRIRAVIEDASIHDIYDIFARKPEGLKFNETDVVIVKARTDGGKEVTRSFYFCMKPDGTFEDRAVAHDTSNERRERLASFIKYYGIAEDLREYNIREKIDEWKGKDVEVIPYEKNEIIYVP